MKIKFPLCTVIILFALISCSTFTVTNEDIDYATKYAIETVLESTQRNIKGHFADEEAFLPDEYSNFIEYKNSIPGMRMLLERWRSYMSSYISQRIVNFDDYVSLITANTNVKDVQHSDTAITDSIRETYEADIRAAINESLKDIDFSLLKDCIIQYNRWVTITSQFNLMQIQISNSDIRDKLTDRFINIYFKELASSEKLFRSVKDAYVDGRVAAVFNLR